MLARMEHREGQDFPQPVGIFRAIERDTYEHMMAQQIEQSIAKTGPGSLEKLIHSGDTWVVE
jgi:2-oxoglutarate ferredoxin oxidoreductase subunit beta